MNVRKWSGSPPHGRGKVLDCLIVSQQVRITPAWAGKRHSYLHRNPAPSDHPRMGGEKNIIRKASFDPMGSPPHGRGKDCWILCKPCSEWITPAWAGKSLTKVRIVSDQRDHPRMGGEKGSVPAIAHNPAGSPPHGRGKVPECQSVRFQSGITPAWAGKRFLSFLQAVRPGDHPRMGGEKFW